jgi:hypothetical protein
VSAKNELMTAGQLRIYLGAAPGVGNDEAFQLGCLGLVRHVHTRHATRRHDYRPTFLDAALAESGNGSRTILTAGWVHDLIAAVVLAVDAQPRRYQVLLGALGRPAGER